MTTDGGVSFCQPWHCKCPKLYGSQFNCGRAGEGANASFDKDVIKRLEQMELLPQEDRQRIFHYIDLVIRDAKTRQAYAS